jgi:hypothetical protein
VRLIPLLAPDGGRIEAIEAVGRFGEAARFAIPTLRAQLAKEPAALRVIADLRATEATAEVEKLALRRDAWVRLEAARALWKLGETKRAETILRSVLASEQTQRSDRSVALGVLADMGPAGIALTDLLPPLFGSHDEWISARAAIAYFRATDDADRVLPTLLTHVGCKPIGFEVVACLAEMGPRARVVLPVLRGALDSELRVGGSPEEDEQWTDLCRDAIAKIDG